MPLTGYLPKSGMVDTLLFVTTQALLSKPVTASHTSSVRKASFLKARVALSNGALQWSLQNPAIEVEPRPEGPAEPCNSTPTAFLAYKYLGTCIIMFDAKPL